MILDKHGVFTWGDTAEESYTRMIDAVTRAERYIEERSVVVSHPTVAADPDLRAAIGPVVRGALARASGRPWVCTLHRPGAARVLRARRSGQGLADRLRRRITSSAPRRGRSSSTPTPSPTWLRVPRTVEQAIARYVAEYHEYFRRSCAARGVVRDELDPFPRVLLFPGAGALCVGGSRAEAEIVADVYARDHLRDRGRRKKKKKKGARRVPRVPELDLFDMEYWSLGQAKLKLGAGQRGPLDRRIALITGAASGSVTRPRRRSSPRGRTWCWPIATRSRSEGSRRARGPLPRPLHEGRRRRAAARSSVHRAFAQSAAHFAGGVDINVSNAGRGLGSLHTSEGHEALCASLELNLLGHQNVARAAARVPLAGLRRGDPVQRVEERVQPGARLRPLRRRQGGARLADAPVRRGPRPQGIRANAVNADRIRTALFGAGSSRRAPAPARLGRRLLPRQPAPARDHRGRRGAAFLYLATAEATTGCVVTVDGGNAAAFPAEPVGSAPLARAAAAAALAERGPVEGLWASSRIFFQSPERNFHTMVAARRTT